MFRPAFLGLGLILLTIGAGCSSDDADPDGGAAVGGRAGSSGAAGSAGAAPTYGVARACEMFAAVSCAKAAECGLVLDETPTTLTCLNCNDTARTIIAEACEEDLLGPKDAATLDLCLANMAAASCSDACANAAVPSCELIRELSGDEPSVGEPADGGAPGEEPLTCDPLCVTG